MRAPIARLAVALLGAGERRALPCRASVHIFLRMATAIHVAPSGLGGWRVERIGTGEAETFPTRKDACERAKVLADEAGGARIVVHDEEGRIDEEAAT